MAITLRVCALLAFALFCGAQNSNAAETGLEMLGRLEKSAELCHIELNDNTAKWLKLLKADYEADAVEKAAYYGEAAWAAGVRENGLAYYCFDTRNKLNSLGWLP